MKKTKVPGLAKNIKMLRANSGLTLDSCAKKLGLKGGKTTFIAYETGKSEPNLTTLLKMSNLFKYSVDEILRYKILVSKTSIFNKCKKCNEDVKSESGRPLNSNYCNSCYWD